MHDIRTRAADGFDQSKPESRPGHAELIHEDQVHAGIREFLTHVVRKLAVPAQRQLEAAMVHAPAQVQQLFLAATNGYLADDVHDVDLVAVFHLGCIVLVACLHQ